MGTKDSSMRRVPEETTTRTNNTTTAPTTTDEQQQTRQQQAPAARHETTRQQQKPRSADVRHALVRDPVIEEDPRQCDAGERPACSNQQPVRNKHQCNRSRRCHEIDPSRSPIAIDILKPEKTHEDPKFSAAAESQWHASTVTLPQSKGPARRKARAGIDFQPHNNTRRP